MTAATARQWQDASLLDLTTETVVAFLAIITSIPPGRRFTVNDLRSRLDAADIPARQRGGLFNRAIAAGLIEAVKVSAWGVDYDVRVASTSAKTHRATVRVYRRTGPES